MVIMTITLVIQSTQSNYVNQSSSLQGLQRPLMAIAMAMAAMKPSYFYQRDQERVSSPQWLYSLHLVYAIIGKFVSNFILLFHNYLFFNTIEFYLF